MTCPECDIAMCIEHFGEHWVREVCPKCGLAHEYFGRAKGTPLEYIGQWIGRKSNETA